MEQFPSPPIITPSTILQYKSGLQLKKLQDADSAKEAFLQKPPNDTGDENEMLKELEDSGTYN